MEKNQLATTTPATAELYRQSTDVAGLCKEIVLKTAVEIQGKKYVRVEGWQSIATAHGCTASARDVERVPGGMRAIGEIRRMSDGVVIATAEGFVGEDEPVWFGGVVEVWRNNKKEQKTHEKRPDYAIRAMTQTRAISRACRTAFAHVVVLMDANLSTTPAEEVPLGGFNNTGREEEPKTAATPKNVTPLPPTMWRNVIVPKFIKKFAGQLLGDLPEKDLVWWANNFVPKPFGGAKEPSEADIAFRKALDTALDDLKGVLRDPPAAPAGEQMPGDPAP